MFCIVISTWVGLHLVELEVTAHCYPSLFECRRSIPSIAHALLPPVRDRRETFRCVREEHAV